MTTDEMKMFEAQLLSFLRTHSAPVRQKELETWLESSGPSSATTTDLVSAVWNLVADHKVTFADDRSLLSS